MGWISLGTNSSRASQTLGLLCPTSCPVAAHPWVGTLVGCLCQARSMAMGLLRP